MNKNRQEKGITLIALVITIIILLILTSVVMKVFLDDELFGRSKSYLNNSNTKIANLDTGVDTLQNAWKKIESVINDVNDEPWSRPEEAGDDTGDGNSEENIRKWLL